MEEILQILLPFLVGGSLGLIGGGGTVLAVPILIYVFGQEPKQAIGMSLGIVSIVSLLGSISHWKKGNVRLENAAFFTPFAMLGAFVGAKVANLSIVTAEIQIVLFGSTVLIASILMILKKSDETEVNSTIAENSRSRRIRKRLVMDWNSILFLAIQGGFVGVLTGLVGVGGGFLIVPSLVFFGKIPIRVAIGTSLVIIFFNSMSGFLGYLGKVSMDWMVMGQFLGLAIVGVLVGVQFGERVPKTYLQKSFGALLFLMGIWLIYNQLVTMEL